MASNSTSSTDTGAAPTSASTPSPSNTSDPPSSSIANSSSPPVISTSSSVTPSPSSSSTLSSSSSETPSSSSTPSSKSTTPTPTTSSPSASSPAIGTTTAPGGSTVTVFQTSTQGGGLNTNTGSSTSSSASNGATANPQNQDKNASGGLGTGGTIAVAVVVPIVVVALLLLAGIFFWRKRKARKDAEELRRKEVEEYGYNPNNDPTLPAVGVVGGSADGPYEMREDGSSGYRGWGTTAVASSGRKASTTVSGGQSAGGIGMAYSEGTSPTHGPVSDTRSDNPLMDGRPLSPEQEALGAMGPAASGNRGGDINRGPSNASSSYSAANRSDGSGEIPPAGAYYNNQYDTGNPYGADTTYGSPPGRAEMSGQPVIRDVQARRNTRIENPSHFPQQSAGISQNF